MAEIEEELKSFLMRMKEKRAGLKLSIQKKQKKPKKLSIHKTKIMASDPITSWQIDGEK